MKPLLRGHFHQAMFFVAIGAGIPLILKCNELKEIISISIYVVCALLMFGISAIYHRINWTPEKRLVFKKLDHAGIYLMIAGTFTPICILVLNDDSGKTLLYTIWSVALFGIIQSLFFVHLPKLVSAVLYLVAGYLIFPYLSEIQTQIGSKNLWLIIIGGLTYSIGALCYGLKKPALWPKTFGYHEVFHLLVNMGAAIHFLVINSIVK